MSSYRMKYKIGLVEHSIVVPEDISSIPLGTILPYSANTLNPPAGFLFCDGSAISRTMYADLFALIGTLYGSGDGSTTFNLPNLIGNKFLEGYSSAGTSKNAGLPNIVGQVRYTAATFASTSLNQAGAYGGTGAFADSVINDATCNVSYMSNSSNPNRGISIYFDASDSNSLYGNSNTVQPSSLTVRYIIKAFHTVSNESAIIDVSNITSDIATRMQRQQIPAFNKRIKLTTSQTWTAPVNGWYKFTLKGGGGGGSGSKSYSIGSYAGSGGGEGGTTIGFEKMMEGDTVSVVIGAGGAGGVDNANGSNGGNSSVVVNSNTYLGGGGAGAASYGGVGGSGTIPGGYGQTGPTLITTNGNFSVASGLGGGGGSTIGADGTGAGGAGGVGKYGVTNSGSSGGSGYCVIEYFDPTL